MSRRKSNAVREESKFITKNSKTFYLNESKTIDFTQTKPTKVNSRPVQLVPKSLNQEKYIIALLDQNTDVVVVSGPAGTGKTYLAMQAAIKALRAGECNRIVLTRPAVSVEDENHGFLPGDLNAKLAPWVRPMIDILREFYSQKEMEQMLADQIIEFAPLGFMRGRTFKNCYIILDESQNCTPAMAKMLLTRIGTGSKIILTGDTCQADRRDADNGLLDLVKRLNKHPTKGITSCVFEVKDVQRHRIIESVLKLYE